MKKILSLLIVLSAIFSLTVKSYSQPKFILNVTGGFSLPTGDFANDITASVVNDTNSESWPYLMKDGYNFGAVGKLKLNKSGTIHAVLGINYNSFSNSANISIPNVVPVNYKFTPKMNIFSISLGAEYGFLFTAKAFPFVGLDFTGNFFSGSFDTDPNQDFEKTELLSTTRFGLQLGGGLDYMFSKNVGGVFGIKYNFANLFGKEANDSTSKYSNKVDLVDKPQTGSSLSIGYIQFYAGVSFYFGRPAATRPKM